MQCRQISNAAPKRSCTCILLNKHVSGKLFTEPDWVGFEIPNEYVIGYGMDSEEEFRNLPMIAVKE